MGSSVYVLNADYTFLNVISWRRAFKMIAKGKVEVVEYTKKTISRVEEKMNLPRVLRMVYQVMTVYKTFAVYSRRNVFLRDGFECGYCGRKVSQPTIDHVIPRSKGGKTIFENVVTCCGRCNEKKEDKRPEEVRMRLRKPLYKPSIMELIAKKAIRDGIKVF